MTENEMSLTEVVKTIVKKNGGIRATSRKFEISASYLSKIASGKPTRPTDDFLETMGIERIETYHIKDA